MLTDKTDFYSEDDIKFRASYHKNQLQPGNVLTVHVAATEKRWTLALMHHEFQIY